MCGKGWCVFFVVIVDLDLCLIDWFGCVDCVRDFVVVIVEVCFFVVKK